MMQQKKDRTTKTLVLSLISLLVAVIWTSTAVTIISSYSDLSSVGVVVMHCIRDFHVDTWNAVKLRCDVEWLREEVSNLSGSFHDFLIFF